MTPIHVVSVVWGEDYTRFFLDCALPSQLAAGNLGILQDRPGSLYRLYTLPADLDVIKQHWTWRMLRGTLDVDVQIIAPDVSLSDQHAAMNVCHRDAIKRAGSMQAALVFLPPDSVWSNGSIAHAIGLLDKGTRLVLTQGIRAVRESGVIAVQKLRDPQSGFISVTGAQLVALVLAHLHPISRALFVDAQAFTAVPSVLYWRVGSRAILVRSFHLHPLLISPVDCGAMPETTIDDNYVDWAVPDLAQHHIVTDSDDVMQVEFSSADRGPWATSGPCSVHAIAQWAHVRASPRHREYLRTCVRLHPSDQWDRAEDESDLLVSDILKRVEAMEPVKG